METVVALAHGFAQLGTGYVVGAGSEAAFNYLTPKVPGLGSYVGVRLVTQFAVSFVILGEVVRGLAGRGIDSPIGDSLMLIAWAQPQKSMWFQMQWLLSEATAEAETLEQDFKNAVASH